MLVTTSGSNSNQFPAELNLSNGTLQLSQLQSNTSPDPNLWNVLGGTSDPTTLPSTLAVNTADVVIEAPRPGDNVNNNNRNKANAINQSPDNETFHHVTQPNSPPPANAPPEVINNHLIAEVEDGAETCDDEDDEVQQQEQGSKPGNDLLSELDLVASVKTSLINCKQSLTSINPQPAQTTAAEQASQETHYRNNINNQLHLIDQPIPADIDMHKTLQPLREDVATPDNVKMRNPNTTTGITNDKLIMMNARSLSMVVGNETLTTAGYTLNNGVKTIPVVTNMTTSATSTTIGVDCIRNNVNNNHVVHLRQGSLSAPNTPRSLRRSHTVIQRRDLPALSHSMYVPSVSVNRPTPMSMSTTPSMMRVNEINNRPLSYHGRSSETLMHTSPSLFTMPTSLAAAVVNKRHVGTSAVAARTRREAMLLNRRSMPSPHLKTRFRDSFDISSLDTNLPRIDLEAIENHLRIAREEERKRRSDREEIRRRLALESDELGDKPGRKPSLHTRLQSSMNLQICFMNETASDSESPNSDNESKNQQPSSLPHVKNHGGSSSNNESNGSSSTSVPSEDFYVKQARLQAEARQALSQAKDKARLQMSQEKEKRLTSPITDMVKNSLLKVGVTLPPERRRVSRQLLTEMNVAQLQVIVNDLHTHIEVLNETLVSMLLERDDLHMEQDSMLVDIEDLTRYLAAKDNSPHHSLPLIASGRSLLGHK